jgi:uncharacterized protein (TIGR03067 family)
VSATIRAANLFAAEPAAAASAISPASAALTEGVLKSMALTRLKAVVAVAALVLLGAGLSTAGLLTMTEPPKTTPDRTEAQDEKKEPKKEPKKALDALQGEWLITKVDTEDEESERLEKLGKVVIKGDKLTILIDFTRTREEVQGTRGIKVLTLFECTILKVDPDKAPATIDLRPDTAINSRQAEKGTMLPGIYSLEGDTLKLLFGPDPRPEAFKEKQGVMTLTRVAQPKGKDQPTEKPAPKQEAAPPKGFTVEATVKKNAQVEFELSYGRNVDGIVKFIVADEDGEVMWAVNGSGQNGIRTITYGVVPVDPKFAGQQQQYPKGNKAPEDIRGRDVVVEVHYRSHALLGPGVEIYRTAFRIPARAGAAPKPVQLQRTWHGEVALDVSKGAPRHDFVTDKEAWAKLWQAYRPKEQVPEVDFNTELVLVAVNNDPNGITIDATLGKEGNLEVDRISTLIQFNNPTTCRYEFALIKRAGVKTIDGVPIGKEKK